MWGMPSHAAVRSIQRTLHAPITENFDDEGRQRVSLSKLTEPILVRKGNAESGFIRRVL